MPEREGDLVQKVALAAVTVIAASVVTVATAGGASAADSTSADLTRAAAAAPQHSALGAALNRVTTTDNTATPFGQFNR